MPKDSYTEGYLKGYEEGITEAWTDIVKLTAKGLTNREINIRAMAVIGTIYQKIEGKKLKLGRETTIPEISLPRRESQEQPIYATPKEGNCYIVREHKPDKSLKIFSAVASRSQKGLCIARTEPSTIKNSVHGNNISFLFLSRSEENIYHENCIQPDLSRIQSAIKEFMDINKNGIILLDGINYLISQNEFGKVLRFIQSIRDDVSPKRFSLIMPIDPDTMDTKEYKQLEAEMQVI